MTNEAGKTATAQVKVEGIVKEDPVQPQPQPQPETPDQNAAPQISAGSVTLSQDKKLASAILTVDANNGTAITEVKADGGKVEPKGENTYAFSATDNGTYTITVTNKAGKTAIAQVKVEGIVKEVPDTAAPQITGLAPAAQSTDYRTASFTFKVADDRGVAQVTVNGQAVTPAADGICQFTASADGVYTVRAVDAAGNEATGSITVSGIVGEIAPTVTHHVQDNGKTAVVTITVSENGGSPIQTVEGQDVTLSGSGSTYTFTATENGTYTVKVTNVTGKTTTHTIPVDCIDTQAPVLAEGSFSVNETKSAAILSIAASDNKALASVTANGQAMTPADGRYTLTVTDNQTYTIRAVDAAGNETTETITVSGIDKTQPKLEASVPTQWGKTVTVTLTASDGESGLAGAPTVSYGGQPVQVTPTNNGYTFTAAANGSYAVSVSDQAGNTTTKTVTVDKVDATAPAAPVLKYDGKAVNTKLKQTLTISGELKLDYLKADGGSPVSTMVKIDQGEKQGQFAKKDSVSFTKNGTYTVTVKTVDAAGNESALVKLTVRYEKPADPTDPQIQPPETETPGAGTEV